MASVSGNDKISLKPSYFDRKTDPKEAADKQLFIRMVDYKKEHIRTQLQNLLSITYSAMMTYDADDLSEHFPEVRSELEEIATDLTDLLSHTLEKSSETKTVGLKRTQNLKPRINQVIQLSKDLQFKKNELKKVLNKLNIEQNLDTLINNEDSRFLENMLNEIDENLPKAALNYQRKNHGNHTPLMFATDLDDPILFKKLLNSGCQFNEDTRRYIVKNKRTCQNILKNLDPPTPISNWSNMTQLFNLALELDEPELFMQLYLATTSKRDAPTPNRAIDWNDRNAVLKLAKETKDPVLYRHLGLKVPENSTSPMKAFTKHQTHTTTVSLDTSQKRELFHLAIRYNAEKIIDKLIPDHMKGITYAIPPRVGIKKHLHAHSSQPFDTGLTLAIRLNQQKTVEKIINSISPQQAQALVNLPSLQLTPPPKHSKNKHPLLLATYPLQLVQTAEMKDTLLSAGANAMILQQETETPQHQHLNHEKQEILTELKTTKNIQKYLTDNAKRIRSMESVNPELLFQLIQDKQYKIALELIEKRLSPIGVPYISPDHTIITTPLILALEQKNEALAIKILHSADDHDLEYFIQNMPSCEPQKLSDKESRTHLSALPPEFVANRHFPEFNRSFFTASEKYLGNVR